MKSIVVQSVMLKSELFQPLEIEIQLIPGLPTIQFIGNPGVGLKESALRIRSALRAAGFEMPKGRQILVDIRPRDEKKHGRGVDLAVAMGFLILTGQIKGRGYERTCFYGDVGLSGDVMAPGDWTRVRVLQNGALVTGVGPADGEFRGGRNGEGLSVITHLRQLASPGPLREFQPAETHDENEIEIGESTMLLEEPQAELAMLAATGGHSLLLAGPQGTGKSTLARLIHRLRPPPSVAESCEIETWSGESTRPLIEPHHTASELAMVGGRQPPRPGAITRAHLGTLLMDEVLLFRPEVQEALREPLETGVVHLARGPDSRKFPAEFQLLGTTNLCECGMYTPKETSSCTCHSRVRARFDSRLRGPFVDRFQLLAYTNNWAPSRGKVSLPQLREKILRASEFQKAQGRSNGNRRWRPVAKPDSETAKLFSNLPSAGSERRRLAIQRVARTFADFEQREEITAQDIFKAQSWALDSFESLRKDGALGPAKIAEVDSLDH